MRPFLVASLMVAAAVLTCHTADARSRYRVITIAQTLSDENPGVAINNRGQVVGHVRNLSGFGESASFWEGHGVSALGTLFGGSSFATDINDSGQVTGTEGVASATEAFRSRLTGGGLEGLLGFDGLGSTSGGGINNAGVVVGGAAATDGSTRPAYWDAQGKIHPLPMLSSSVPGTHPVSGTGVAINETGEMAGTITLAFDDRQVYGGSLGVIWKNGAATNLGSLEGDTNAVYVVAMNDQGHVIGQSGSRAFFYNGGMTEVPALEGTVPPGGVTVAVHGINSKGLVVGQSLVASSDVVYHGFVWDTTTGLLQDLNDLLPADTPWEIQSGFAVNDYGQITAIAYKRDAAGNGLGFFAVLISPPSRGFDISAMAPPPSLATFQDLRGDSGIEFVIIDGWGGKSRPKYARQYLSLALDAGLKTAGFCLLNFKSKDDGACQVDQALANFGVQAALLGFMAIDVEDPRPLFDLPPGLQHPPYSLTAQQAAVARIEEAVVEVTKAGLRPIIYTKEVYWSQIAGDTIAFSGLPLWHTEDDQIADLEVPDLSAHPFGGWSERTGKQYDVDTAGHTPTLPGFGAVDLNVFEASAFADSNPNFSSIGILEVGVPTLQRVGSKIRVTLSAMDTGARDCLLSQILGATLGAADSSKTFPVALTMPATPKMLNPVVGEIDACRVSRKVSLVFPGTVGKKGDQVALTVVLSYNGSGALPTTLQVTLP